MSGLGASSLSAYSGPVGMVLMAITNAMSIMSSMEEKAKMNTPQMSFGRDLYNLQLYGQGKQVGPAFTGAEGMTSALNSSTGISTAGLPGSLTPGDLAKFMDGMEKAGAAFGKTNSEVQALISEALGPANTELIQMANSINLTSDAMGSANLTFNNADNTIKVFSQTMGLSAKQTDLMTMQSNALTKAISER